MPLPYRTILHLPPQVDLIGLAEQEVQTWLEGRNKVDAERRTGFLNGTFFEPGIHDLGGDRTLAVARVQGENDDSRRLLLRYTEPNAAGTWQVDVVALDFLEGSRRSDNLIIEAVRLDQPDADGQVDPPALVRQLLARETVLDGQTLVTAEPQLIGVGEIGEVLIAVLDQGRSVSVVVAASAGADTDTQLRAIVKSLTSKLVGAASVFVLTSDAAKALNSQLPASHRVEAGQVRTYLPRVDVESTADGRRHRMLGPQTFARAIYGQRVAPYLQASFAIQTRSALLADPMPRGMRRRRSSLEDELARITREASVEQQLQESREEALRDAPAIVPIPGSSPVMARVRRLIARWLGREEVDPEATSVEEIDALLERVTLEAKAVAADLEKVEAQFTDLQEESENFKDDYEYRGLELAESEKETSKLRDHVRYLQRELAKSSHADAYGVIDEVDWSTPSDLVELALVLTPGTADHPAASIIEFTGDLDRVSETHLRDQSGLYVQRCWEFIRVLYDYAQLRAEGAFAGNVHSYLQSPDHDGTKVSASRHAPSETKQTIEQWGGERIFPVPVDCAADGHVAMYAHFKAGQDNTFAPRMHYYDDTAKTGKVYIGYIGRHLHNTKTANA